MLQELDAPEEADERRQLNARLENEVNDNERRLLNLEAQRNEQVIAVQKHRIEDLQASIQASSDSGLLRTANLESGFVGAVTENDQKLRLYQILDTEHWDNPKCLLQVTWWWYRFRQGCPWGNPEDLRQALNRKFHADISETAKGGAMAYTARTVRLLLKCLLNWLRYLPVSSAVGGQPSPDYLLEGREIMDMVVRTSVHRLTNASVDKMDKYDKRLLEEDFKEKLYGDRYSAAFAAAGVDVARL